MAGDRDCWWVQLGMSFGDSHTEETNLWGVSGDDWWRAGIPTELPSE
mgnify:CR=1 FL=1